MELMKKKWLLAACIIAGIALYAFIHEWIIIRNPLHLLNNKSDFPLASITKKRVTLWYWHNDAWHHEQTDLIWSNEIQHNLNYLITSWLTMIDEEHIIDKKIALQSVLVTSSTSDVYFSFDRSPFNQEDSTHAKLMLIEGILKTIASNEIKVNRVHFLVHHAPLIDPHLDFSVGWPIQGFIEK
jgi:hypothetical protein